MVVFGSLHITPHLIRCLPKLRLETQIGSVISLAFSHSKTLHFFDKRYPNKKGSLPLNLRSQFVISKQKNPFFLRIGLSLPSIFSPIAFGGFEDWPSGLEVGGPSLSQLKTSKDHSMLK